MATIWKEVTVAADPEQVWRAVRDVGAAHVKLFPGVLTATRMEAHARVVTFADGREIREPIVTVDDDHMRFAWTVAGGLFEHHNASLQVVAERGGGSRVVWITDVLPDAAAPMVQQLVDAGAAAMKATLDRTVNAIESRAG